MDRPLDRVGNTPCRFRRQRYCALSAELRVGAFRDPGRTRYRVSTSRRAGRRAEIRSRADRGHASAVHPRARESGSGGAMLYEILKALHIVAVIAWMAG